MLFCVGLCSVGFVVGDVTSDVGDRVAASTNTATGGRNALIETASDVAVDAGAESVLPPVINEPLRLLGGQQEDAYAAALQGTWIARAGKQDISLTFSGSERYRMGDSRGTFSVRAKTIILTSERGAFNYDFELAGADALAPLRLTLSGGDMVQPLTFTAQRPTISRSFTLRDVFVVPKLNILPKLKRMLAVLAIVLVSRIFIGLLRGISHALINSELGPLKYLFRQRKNRTMTIHALVLNIIKYVVYFGALGRILNEVGVNYTAYFASLSVVGLAIGFGSQGLVQDIVTGFFVIFEGQFDVGDMVEISAQIGIVEELGLRMTRMRNYVGQTVTIPNRNIALVGTYRNGAMGVRVDVALRDAADADKAKTLLAAISGEIGKQYAGAVLKPISVSGPSVQSTGECFMRVETGIWPMQQWVIDQQLIPRLREYFKREGLEIPGDRVTAFYHLAKPRVRRARP
jgi:moderate conductance mechanosensitive channel